MSACASVELSFRPRPRGYRASVMHASEPHGPPDPKSRTQEQETASGRADWTPFAVLGSVIMVIACVVAVALALAVLAFYLA
jgi:hypothetical protein